MSKQSVTVVGFGNMGRSLVVALRQHGHEVTVWTRRDSTAAVTKLGASFVADLPTALRASEVTVACLSSYLATDEVLSQPDVAESLAGRTLVQLSTGLEDDARRLAAWSADRGIRYLDGKIAVLPASIGLESAVMFYGGDEQVFEQCVEVLRAMAGQSVRVSDDPGASSLADFGFLCFFFFSTVGMMYASAFFQAAGLDEKVFLSLAPNFAKDITDRAPSIAAALEAGTHDTDIQSTLKVDANGAALLAQTARRLALDPGPAEYLARVFGEAAAAGHAEKDTGALIKVFRGSW